RAEDRIRSGESFLVILSSDASANTKKKFNNMCNFRELPLIELWDRNVLGHCIGREFAVVISVADEGFAKQIIALNEIEVSEFGTAECNTPLNIERID
ncbi:MAG: ribosomal L7Ae/L30e/S12e/Gadd45 family protein, partial [Oscillospiraceae bacterium]